MSPVRHLLVSIQVFDGPTLLYAVKINPLVAYFWRGAPEGPIYVRKLRVVTSPVLPARITIEGDYTGVQIDGDPR